MERLGTDRNESLLYGTYYTESRKIIIRNGRKIISIISARILLLIKLYIVYFCVIGKVDNFLYKIHNILYSLGNTTTLLLWYDHWLCSTHWTWNHFKQVKYSIIVPSSGRRHKQKISTSKVPVVHMYTCMYAHA